MNLNKYPRREELEDLYLNLGARLRVVQYQTAHAVDLEEADELRDRARRLRKVRWKIRQRLGGVVWLQDEREAA